MGAALPPVKSTEASRAGPERDLASSWKYWSSRDLDLACRRPRIGVA